MSGTNLDRVCAKILVLGDSGVGKSSLIHLICHSTTLSSSQWTIGCSIEVKLHENCFLEFWDIGGSRAHRIARSFLYQDYHGILLVFDSTNKKSRSNLNEWLLEVSTKSNDRDLDNFVNINVPILAIATKKDLLPYGSSLGSFDDEIRGQDLSLKSFKGRDCSVVNFNNTDIASNNFPTNRRLQSVSNLLPYQSSSASLLSGASTSSLPAYHPEIPAWDNQVIYVNTQDVLSFSPDTKSYEKLSNFFRQVIDTRNKRFYNKFAI